MATGDVILKDLIDFRRRATFKPRLVTLRHETLSYCKHEGGPEKCISLASSTIVTTRFSGRQHCIKLVNTAGVMLCYLSLPTRNDAAAWRDALKTARPSATDSDAQFALDTSAAAATPSFTSFAPAAAVPTFGPLSAPSSAPAPSFTFTGGAAPLPPLPAQMPSFLQPFQSTFSGHTGVVQSREDRLKSALPPMYSISALHSLHSEDPEWLTQQLKNARAIDLALRSISYNFIPFVTFVCEKCNLAFDRSHAIQVCANWRETVPLLPQLFELGLPLDTSMFTTCFRSRTYFALQALLQIASPRHGPRALLCQAAEFLSAGPFTSQEVDTLLQLGADIDYVLDGYTAIHRAALSAFPASAYILLQKGASANVLTHDGESVLSLLMTRVAVGACWIPKELQQASTVASLCQPIFTSAVTKFDIPVRGVVVPFGRSSGDVHLFWAEHDPPHCIAVSSVNAPFSRLNASTCHLQKRSFSGMSKSAGRKRVCPGGV
eukprot:TRINITY_DN6493_c0_g1_i1.p1 TRINITY_DN6493_c0_g1~~TRINITY_DN6493_c0_g1_i1.p1  ORF type:complete len:491 (+),score=73.26 TRINITY_DN6493_c0_g1_i1:188-1660(+)